MVHRAAGGAHAAYRVIPHQAGSTRKYRKGLPAPAGQSACAPPLPKCKARRQGGVRHGQQPLPPPLATPHAPMPRCGARGLACLCGWVRRLALPAPWLAFACRRAWPQAHHSGCKFSYVLCPPSISPTAQSPLQPLPWRTATKKRPSARRSLVYPIHFARVVRRSPAAR